ncbi:hypothetical protein LOK49_Contig180G00022 [Camellia lanceoleosa]|nr:hypothetical protein LOK49_Contig180G00022 [Camellia lanceoleosa]
MDENGIKSLVDVLDLVILLTSVFASSIFSPWVYIFERPIGADLDARISSFPCIEDFAIKAANAFAYVKIIKCLVENIVVDISFNQLGGLCTLCFLEEVDHLINQNHLFKRSIILIKAWCYYESRVLGAHHGLISTYALETLVLYIFHVFNNSFTGPLEVLYRFLEFFSNFDWDNFCVSLWGPVSISSLPDVTAEPPRKDSGELLLSKLFLDACSSVYAVFPSGQENQGQPFVSKHFNVIDPLRVNNNLGRSVSKDFFNWNKVKIRCCDGASSFAGQPERVSLFGKHLWMSSSIGLFNARQSQHDELEAKFSRRASFEAK